MRHDAELEHAEREQYADDLEALKGVLECMFDDVVRLDKLSDSLDLAPARTRVAVGSIVSMKALVQRALDKICSEIGKVRP